MGITDPRVSVVLPTYNRAESLSESVRSVLDQTCADFELIVVDDGSTDDTKQTIAGIDDPRIKYVGHEANRGVSAARNTGIEAAQGNIIAFQDSDDTWFPEKLEKQLSVFDDTSIDVGVVYTGMWREIGGDRKYLPYPSVDPKEGDITDSIHQKNFISTQMAAARAECFETVGGFDEELPALVDWELWIRLAEQYQFRLVDEALVSAEVRSDSISTDRSKIVEARARIVDKHGEKFDADVLANHLFYVGHGAMKAGQPERGREYLRRAVRTKFQPLYAGCWGLSLAGLKTYSAVYGAVKGVRGWAGRG